MSMSSSKRKTGGRWNPGDDFKYFLVNGGRGHDLVSGLPPGRGPIHHDHLVALNEFPANEYQVIDMLAAGCDVLLDSGTYAFASRYSRMHDIPLQECFSMSHADIDGLDEFIERYIEIVSEYAPSVWGYIEIDLGSTDEKIKLRKEIEAEGLAPIPVFHVMTDTMDYFYALVEEYDRVCIGNIVSLNRNVRSRVIHHVLSNCGDCWIHFLGVSPGLSVASYPGRYSCDSSSWVNALRWPGFSVLALESIGDASLLFQYSRSSVGDQYQDCTRALGLQEAMRVESINFHFSEVV